MWPVNAALIEAVPTPVVDWDPGMGGGSTGVGEEVTSAPGVPCYYAAYTKTSSNGQCE